MLAPLLAGWYCVRVAALLPASQAVNPAVRQAAATTTARRPMGLKGLRLRLTGCSLDGRGTGTRTTHSVAVAQTWPAAGPPGAVRKPAVRGAGASRTSLRWPRR